MTDFLTTWLASAPAFMTPLLLASVGLILCERAGVLNLGAEGIMAIGAMTGAFSVVSGASPFAALVFGALAGLAVSIPFLIAVVVFRAEQILAGLALVAIGLGVAATLGRDIAHTPFSGIRNLTLPDALTGIPYVGGMLFSQNALTYVSVLIAIVAALFLARGLHGLRLRAVGEDPATADAAGVDVQLYQIGALTAGCLLIGLAGAYLSVAGSRVWVDGMVAGRGWIAIGLVVFAQWSPLRAILGALIFGAADALIPRLQATGVDVPVYILSMTPYVLTIVLLVVVALAGGRRSAEPGFLGRAYLRQDR
ncbi:ABC transporter permease [Acuticoccus sp. MNP-M23]|uniref:ABC transporter permease n=1 Tax=Acuticoccus sp. MNP-M23 TaxID=3072793 RepID=UPI0028156CDE|nr:ABC transporter permease [Acuticoccus sp. MNP-M23]WMS44724.1 ABC transporter permease [Acuticoccus sp. MNP-M23]